jgi:L-arabinonolactonase
MDEVEHLLAVGNRVGEGPRWNVAEQALYWVDIEGHAIWRYHPADGRLERWDLGLPVGALAFRAGGGLVLATRDGFAFWDPAAPTLRFIADPEADRPDNRFNDAGVDPRGRFWAGTMGGGDPVGNLYRLDPDGAVTRMETGVRTSNGIGWSPDGRLMYYTDSEAKVIYAYDYDPARGAIANRRDFISTPDEAGVPDGLAVDVEGYIWSARWDGWKITRYDPAGRAVREIRLPVARVTSCAFGGADLDELYITSAWSGLTADARRAQPAAGDVFRLRPGVRGMAEPHFAG